MLDASSAYILHQLIFRLNRVGDNQLKDRFDISYDRALVLAAIHHQKNTTQHNLAVTLGRTDAAVSIMLGKLEKENLVKIRKSQQHLRKNTVALTNTGVAVLEKIYAHFSAQFDKLVANAGVDSKAYSEMNRKIYETLIERIANG